MGENNEQLYKNIKTEIDNVQKIFDESPNPSDKELQEVQQNALAIFENFKTQNHKELDALNNKQEWKTFTIGLYGETNAGKSTIIETLRIYFNENSKNEERANFQKAYEYYQSIQEEIAKYKNEQEALKSKHQELETSLQTEQDEIKAEQNELKTKEVESNAKLENTMQQRDEECKSFDVEIKSLELKLLDFRGFFAKLFGFFTIRKIQSQIAILQSKKDYIYKDYENNPEVKALQEQIQSFQEKSKELEEKIKGIFSPLREIESKMSHLDSAIKATKDKNQETIQSLEQNQDGKNISAEGDFTKKLEKYDFHYNGNTFRLLDIPGIEGNEKEVINEIKDALREAHAILYIKNNPNKPQKGDENDKHDKKGILEKLNEQLSAQSEVYAVFNKRITSLKAFPDPDAELINDKEKIALKGLDEEMRKILGEHYVTHKVCSALPALLSCGNFAPESSNLDKQEKFLQTFSKEQIWEKSGFKDFADFISIDLPQNSKEKIKAAHITKANDVLKSLLDMLQTIQEKQYRPLLTSSLAASEQIKENLDISFKKFWKNCKNAIEDSVDKLKNVIEKRIYDEIEKNISNENFKNEFEKISKEEFARLEQSLPKSIESCQERFKQDIQKDLERYQERMEDLIENLSRISLQDRFGNILDISKIDNGINTWGLLGSIGGGAVGIWGTIALSATLGPIGMAVGIGAAVITALLGTWKSIKSWFDDDYKKSEQRKQAEETLQKIKREVQYAIIKELDSKESEMRQPIESIKAQLYKKNENLKSLLNTLEKIQEKLKIIQSNLTKI